MTYSSSTTTLAVVVIIGKRTWSGTVKLWCRRWLWRWPSGVAGVLTPWLVQGGLLVCAGWPAPYRFAWLSCQVHRVSDWLYCMVPLGTFSPRSFGFLPGCPTPLLSKCFHMVILKDAPQVACEQMVPQHGTAAREISPAEVWRSWLHRAGHRAAW